LDYGFEAAGFETVVAIESDSICCNTLSINRPHWTVLNQPIEAVASRQITLLSGLKKREFDMLIGGPPCQPFSKSSYWVNGKSQGLNDPRANTLKEYFRVVDDLLPKCFVLENVYGMAYQGKDEGMHLIEREIRRINRKNGTNYTFDWEILNSANFGVPQTRERLFIVSNREGKPFDFPEPRFGDNRRSMSRSASDKSLPKYRTAWDAIGHLEPTDDELWSTRLKGKYADLLPTIPEGQNYLFHTDRGGGSPIFEWRSRYWSFLLKLSKDLPSWTIQAQPGPAIGPFHWDNRRLTAREMAAIQTFPENVSFYGQLKDAQKQIGNAVPSAIGELLGLEIRRQFFGDKSDSSSLSLIPKHNSKVHRKRRRRILSEKLQREFELAEV
jgi:DNA (cytosine-5)-methyltransferase 1